MKKFLLLIFITLLPITSQALTLESFCVQYKLPNKEQWSNSLVVEAAKLYGSELNKIEKKFIYDSFSTYIILSWTPDVASIVKLKLPGLSAVNSLGIDAHNIEWKIKDSDFCINDNQ